ncbi:MAG: hypothetical protein H0V37_09575 [Chloroflexia bacterium]|nr:hypothetical protein [Chloroflexia bacterium]
MLAIAHRGASAYAPENTRTAFDLAIRMGSDLIETDVQVTRDGELVLIHDDLVDRTSDGSGPVADYTLAELRRLDFGTWFGAGIEPQRIVTLAEFWSDYLSRVPVCLEIKDPLATDALIRFLQSTTYAEERVQVTSFSWSAVLRAKAAPSCSIGFLSRIFNEDLIDRCASRGFAQICPPVNLLDAALVETAHRQGLTVRAWGIKQRSDIDQLFETGADGATTNWPDWITGHPAYVKAD